jgi:hypothetical protein
MRMRTVLFAILALLGTSLVSHAGVIYTVSLDTTVLVGTGPYWLAFQFADGSGTGDANNAAVLSDFQFGSGGPVATQYISGPASGSLTGSVSLSDSDPLLSAFFAQQFTPGAALSFVLQLTTEVDPGGVYDQFTFGIADNGFAYLPTTSTLAPDVFLSVLVDSDTPTREVSGTDLNRTIIALDAPQVDNAVPEPATWLPVGLVLGVAGCLRRRRAHRG